MNRTIITYAIIIMATAANATADRVMLLMGTEVGRIWSVLDWTMIQWYWHILKWIFFNASLGAFSCINIGIKKTAILAAICFLLWELIYEALGL